jgi:hypothetical protein
MMSSMAATARPVSPVTAGSRIRQHGVHEILDERQVDVGCRWMVFRLRAFPRFRLRARRFGARRFGDKSAWQACVCTCTTPAFKSSTWIDPPVPNTCSVS